ncbi:MAG: RNA polymerase sigma-70 factor [Flavobacteriales bacterium]|nr:RNA polymerase sigma-70 factor [Flavobacteriales bacterium]
MTRSEFNILFERLYSPLCNYAFTIVKDHAEAEDIVQTIFVDFWNKPNKDDIEAKLDNYLIRAVKFKCIDLQRKVAVKRKYEAEAIHTAVLVEEDKEEENPNLKDILHLAIAQLPEKTREVFVMSKLDGLSYKEIAEHMGISPKTVENQMGRAFKHLREKLKSHKDLLVLFIFLMLE